MKIQLTILGLGQIGTSIGMALDGYQEKIFRVGHDKYRVVANQAKEKNALDKIAFTLSGAVEEADIVLLALPFQEIYPVLEHIAPDLKEDVLVIDTGPLKQPVLQWVEELLPENRHYVGLTPVIQSSYLEECSYGPEVAKKDLFSGCLMALVSRPGSNEKAISLAVNLVELLGATPYFTDPAEIDGLMTMTYLMPRLLAASLLKTTQDAPGWREARKIAGKAYALISNPMIQDDIPGALAAAMIYNTENTSRVLNDIIRTLVEIRDSTETPGQEELTEMFLKLQQGRDLWWADRRDSNWIDVKRTDLPKSSFMGQLFGIRKPTTPKKDRDK